MTREEFNNLKIGDKVKFHCFDGSIIDVEVTEISQEDWDNMKFEITNCFRSYRYGSC